MGFRFNGKIIKGSKISNVGFFKEIIREQKGLSCFGLYFDVFEYQVGMHRETFHFNTKEERKIALEQINRIRNKHRKVLGRSLLKGIVNL